MKEIQLSIASAEHIPSMMAWFDSLEKLSVWSGPGFRHPFDRESFVEDLKLDELDSYVLLDTNMAEQNQIMAFGQFYNRLNRCHLSRLVVAPAFRGRGIVGTLINELSTLGRYKLSVKSDSLFVLPENSIAVRAYAALGFKTIDYPQLNPLEGCLYMIRN